MEIYAPRETPASTENVLARLAFFAKACPSVISKVSAILTLDFVPRLHFPITILATMETRALQRTCASMECALVLPIFNARTTQTTLATCLDAIQFMAVSTIKLMVLNATTATNAQRTPLALAAFAVEVRKLIASTNSSAVFPIVLRKLAVSSPSTTTVLRAPLTQIVLTSHVRSLSATEELAPTLPTILQRQVVKTDNFATAKNIAHWEPVFLEFLLTATTKTIVPKTLATINLANVCTRMSLQQHLVRVVEIFVQSHLNAMLKVTVSRRPP
ncbi:MAG: hypothetical protein BVN35_17640 [Proteobacteria bacterium ST_bin11]|nr:MAG: hypothetical protein BVN35_17640 [Proteobacteria bacterium ST_bin11]